jgi:glyoxylase-like metal-dependent hydrolase (beta-lactamase superfamily II)
VIETPGHAPSHVCLHQPERRLLISGDHLLGRVSLYFDRGHTPDPVGEFLGSLDAVEGLDARLALAGHGRSFTDVRAHIAANRALVAERLGAVRAALRERPGSAFELARRVHGEAFGEDSATLLLNQTLSWLDHLELRGEAARHAPAAGEPEIWSP